MPATLLEGRAVRRRHGARTVLDRVDLRVDATSRIGLVGPNGAGKSTLLRVLAGVEPADEGHIKRHGSVGWLPQLADEGDGVAARAVVAERLGVAAASRRLDVLADRLTAGDLEVLEEHAAALEAWLALGGDDLHARLAVAAASLGLDPELLDRPLAALSGGQAARVGLATLTCARHDVLLLDEPTNHLDAGGLEHLRALLSARSGWVLVSHDRALLAAVCEELVTLDPRTGTATHHADGWGTYEAERDAARRREQAAYDAASARRDQLERAAAEMRRRASASQARVRPGAATSDGDKHGREWVAMRADGARSRARKVADRAARVAVPDRPWAEAPLALDLGGAAARAHGTQAALEGAVLRRGDWSVGPLDLAVDAGARVRLAGANGTGKSTVLAALAGTQPLAAGRRHVAPSARIGVLGQDRDALLGPEPVAAAVRAHSGAGEAEARGALASFGLGAEVAVRAAASLSPGERTRAELALLALLQPTALLLDEPTNHLDVASLEVVEAALATWPGALVVATHDERLAAALALEEEVRL